jgi:hypothetical protein
MRRQLPEARRGFAKLLRRPGVVQEGWKASSVETPPIASRAEREQNFFLSGRELPRRNRGHGGGQSPGQKEIGGCLSQKPEILYHC